VLGGPASAAIAEQDRILLQMGLVAERPTLQPVELWAEHWPAVQLFDATLTQWTLGADGRRVGLRYEALAAVMDLFDIPAGDRRATFDDLQVLELAALEHWRLTNPR